MTSPSKPWFIHDQRWSLLAAVDDARNYLNPEEMRPGKITESAEGREREIQWITVDDRDDVVFNRRTVNDRNGNPIDCRLLAITSDAGMGKSNATEWIQYRLNCAEAPTVRANSGSNDCSNSISFHFEIREFVTDYRPQRITIEDDLKSALAKKWLDACDEKVKPAIAQIVRYIETLLRRGEICLIFDGLDQVGDTEINVLNWLLDSPEIKNCRFIIAGRPNAIITKWDKLFANRNFAFLQVDEFNRAQQVRYLGWLPDGKIRYQAIDRDARPILYVPRVLSYLREVNSFRDIRTAADVYHFAIDKMIYGALEKMYEGVQPNNSQVQGLIGLLAITAFETMRLYHGDECTFQRSEDDPRTLTHIPSRPQDEPPDYEYNLSVSEIEDGGNFEELVGRIKASYQSRQLCGTADDQWQLLGQLNTILDQGIFDDQRSGLNQVVWSNRSIHEFLLAQYFAQYATGSEFNRLWDWIYISGVPSTDKYYQFWQFLCEMPGKSRNSQPWLNSVELLYWPNIAAPLETEQTDPDNPASPFFAKRSSEMIYRSWETLDSYCQSKMADAKRRSNQIRDRWWSEFEEVFVTGNCEPRFHETARAIIDHFMVIPTGPVVMGTTDDKQRPPELIRLTRNLFESWIEDPERIDQWLEESGWNRSRRADARFLDEFEPRLKNAVAKRNFAAYLEILTVGNEGRVVLENVDSFQLGRHPISNQFYRLFDPGHGIELRSASYEKYSNSQHHPAIRVSFFDCFVFCKWLRWENDSCRLPWEFEWERAAKLGFDDWSQSYWWGDDFDKQRDLKRINCKDTEFGSTLIPSPERASPNSKETDLENGGTGDGLMDMLGNCWEWCQDQYRFQYGQDPDQPQLGIADLARIDASARATHSRSLRGGSFDVNAHLARCSFRFHHVPSISYSVMGCRVARARKS